MKILLVHPEESPNLGPWAEVRWDWVVDLGWSGRYWYSRESERLGYRISSIYDLLDHAEHHRQLRALLGVCAGHLIDSESIDWWELFSASQYQQFDQLLAVAALAEQVGERPEIFATRPHPATEALARGLKNEIKYLSGPRPMPSSRIRRYFNAASTFRPSQLAEIAFDKWDTDYQFRRHLRVRQPSLNTPTVLLPSSYVNVSRAQVAYARMLPHRQFLLVVTRPSGRRLQLPQNVAIRALSSYAPRLLAATGAELAELMKVWRRMRHELFAQGPVLQLALDQPFLAGLPNYVKNGLRVRDAWREVIEHEPISSVLTADEHNAFTRFPVLLAQRRNLRTVFCDHGALNLSLGIRPACSDTYLASGEMARDYMVEWAGLPPARIVTGGPDPVEVLRPSGTRRDWIVFFSEQYELSDARTQVLYAELLPELCALARNTGRKVILKLHPFESGRSRRRLVERVLSIEDALLIEFREGALTPDLFHRAWFSVTVESSIALESTLQGVPCFLCNWFNPSWYDYARQYAKYSAGYLLDSPTTIRQIPQWLEGIEITEEIRRRLRSPIREESLESLLYGA